jgi:hypothetical protein
MLYMQAMTKSGTIDFIKIDIEGEEKQLFKDRSSWPILCEIRCIATEIHGWVAGAEEAFSTFLRVCSLSLAFFHAASCSCSC